MTTNNIEDCIEQDTKGEISRERPKIRNPICREIVRQFINFIFKSFFKIHKHHLFWVFNRETNQFTHFSKSANTFAERGGLQL